MTKTWVFSLSAIFEMTENTGLSRNSFISVKNTANIQKLQYSYFAIVKKGLASWKFNRVVIDDVHARYAMKELSMDDMEWVNAAGYSNDPGKKRRELEEGKQ